MSVIPIRQNSGFLVYKTNLLTIVEIKQGDLLKTSFVFKNIDFFAFFISYFNSVL